MQIDTTQARKVNVIRFASLAQPVAVAVPANQQIFAFTSIANK